MTKNTPRPLRLWPGVAIVTLQWLLWLVLPALSTAQEAQYAGVFGGLLGGLGVLVWWAFFSRASGVERWGAVLLLPLALAAMAPLLDESIATAMMGLMFVVYAVPPLSLAFVGWAVLSRGLADGPRRLALVATVLVACGAWALLRTDGLRTGGADFAWRWSPTAEDRLLARAEMEPVRFNAPPAPAIPEPVAEPSPAPMEVEPVPTPAEPKTPRVLASPAWPGFRGPQRDGVIRGVRVETDWVASPPVELWRRPVGPGWSSFAVQGGLLYTQEQRGDDEIVAAYSLDDGAPVWAHADAARFWEANAGAGPRGTPTLHQGRVYAFGGTGILNALDAQSGELAWSRNVSDDAEKSVPGWGFSSSPLVVGETVVVAAAGILAAYDVQTGEPRWVSDDGGSAYSSPHFAELGGTPQLLFVRKSGVASFAPETGTVLWQHDWPGNTRIVQPALTPDGDLILSGGESSGVRRISVAPGAAGWSVEERWTSFRLKPYFSDFVVHEGHAYGFDGAILACVDLADGERKWKGGRYGQGQLVLLADQDVLLVLSEEGELALVRATPDSFAELARVPAIEGKTWNHPVLAGDVLLVRNAEEMAAFRLRPAKP